MLVSNFSTSDQPDPAISFSSEVQFYVCPQMYLTTIPLNALHLVDLYPGGKKEMKYVSAHISCGFSQYEHLLRSPHPIS